MIQPGVVFGLLEAFLHMPAAARGPGQVHQAGTGRAVAGVIGDLTGVVQGAAGQQPVPAARLSAGRDADPGPVVLAGAVGAGTYR